MTGVRPRSPSNIGVPELGAGVISRPRAIGELLHRLEGARLLHVVGPAGAGKTTLVAQAAPELEIPLGWLTLEEWDRDPGRLLSDVVAALGRALPSVRSVLGDESDDPREGAYRVGSLAGARDVVLVVDNGHLLNAWGESAEVVAGLLAGRAGGLKLVVISRFPPRLPRIGADVLAHTAEVGDDVLRADAVEAAAILAARGSDADPAALLAETGGWVTGLVLSGRRGGLGAVDGLAMFLGSEVRPSLRPADDAFLAACSVFDYVDHGRALAVGGDEGPSMLVAVRAAGVPGVWDEQGGQLRLHPRIREILRAELEAGPGDTLRAALAAAASAYEDEGRLELALDAAIGASDLVAARRLLPQVIGLVVGRLEIERAQALLAAVPFAPAPEPDAVVVARIELASLRQRAADGLAVIDELDERGDLGRIVKAWPNVGALGCNILAAGGRIDEAFDLLDMIPVGRAADAARLVLSSVRDDPGARIPSFAGDSLDAVIARGLYCRGRIADLQRLSNAALARLSGVPQLAGQALVPSTPLAAGLARFAEGVAARDRDAAEASVEEIASYIGESSIFARLAVAELALRLERDPKRALDALDRACALAQGEVPFYRELIDTWRGGALLLRGDADAEALEVLRGVVLSMRAGDRALELPTALVYLAEAEWRSHREEAADLATRDAHAVARRSGLLPRLMLALADFPGVLSRALDIETEPDGEWHALGRAIVAVKAGQPVGAGSVHLRELGEPALFVDGIAVRPKIRKSLELLSYLLSRPRLAARRSEVLHALWNGRDDDASRGYLRQAVRHLREVLPTGAALEAAGDVLCLAGGFTSEVAELDALLRSAAQAEGAARRTLLVQAIEKSRRGTFMEGSRDVAWIDERRGSIEARLLGARLDVAETLFDESRFLDVLVLADEVLEHDPQLERAWRMRMRALAMLGDLDGVLDALRECSAALRTLGVTPSRGTLELAHRLRA